jgi:hypothetical protein
LGCGFLWLYKVEPVLIKAELYKNEKLIDKKSNEVSVESDFKEGLSQQCIDFYKELDELNKQYPE